MPSRRVFSWSDHLQPSEDEPIRSIVHQSADATVVAWCVLPGQRIAPHVHPGGQDTWTIVAGQGDYQMDEAGFIVSIGAGDVVVALTGEAHGVLNTGTEPLVFMSVVCPADAGYWPLAVPSTLSPALF